MRFGPGGDSTKRRPTDGTATDGDAGISAL